MSVANSKSIIRTRGTRARRSLHVVIDRELDALINAAVERDGLSTSAIVRDALRSYFNLDDPRGRGWREGLAAGIADVQRRVRDAIASIGRE